jgi:hypothetical protein
MKSAYGRQILAPDYELTCVAPGSPMGELMRRYWQRVCTSEGGTAIQISGPTLKENSIRRAVPGQCRLRNCGPRFSRPQSRR